MSSVKCVTIYRGHLKSNKVILPPMNLRNSLALMLVPPLFLMSPSEQTTEHGVYTKTEFVSVKVVYPVLQTEVVLFSCPSQM